MGNHSSGESNFSTVGWQRIGGDQDMEVYVNKLTGEEIEGYSYLINDESLFKTEKEVFNFRLNSNTLVASRYLLQQKQTNLCNTTFNGKIFLEPIPTRLSKIDQIPYPDILHVYQQCFTGFKQLFQFTGYFDITQDLICVNKQGVVKVWLNWSLEKIRPDISYGGLSMEGDMVDRAIKIIDRNTNHLTLPCSMVEEFGNGRVGSFEQALNVLNEISLKNKMPIPGNLKSAEELLGRTNQVVVQSYHQQVGQQDIVPVYEASSSYGKISLNSRRDNPNVIHQQQPLKMVTSITPTGNGNFPARISTSKYTTNPQQKINSTIKQITSNQLPGKGTSLDSVQERNYAAGIYESPPIASKFINNQTGPVVSNFMIPQTSNVLINLQKNTTGNQNNISSVNGSQAGSFQFKSHHQENSKIKEVNFTRHPVHDSAGKNIAFKNPSMNNTVMSFEKKNNHFYGNGLNQTQVKYNVGPRKQEQPQFIQFKYADIQQTYQHPANMLKQSNQPRGQPRTLSLQNVANQHNPYITPSQFKPQSKLVHPDPSKQVRTPTIQFHQQPNNTHIYKDIPSVSKRSATRTQTNQSDRTHLVRLNIDTELRQSTTPVFISKTPTHYHSTRMPENVIERMIFQRDREIQQLNLFGLEQKSQDHRQFLTNGFRQDGRFSNHKKYLNQEIPAVPTKTVLRFGESEQQKSIGNATGLIQFDMNKSVERKSQESFYPEKAHAQTNRIPDNQIRHSYEISESSNPNNITQDLNKSN